MDNKLDTEDILKQQIASLKKQKAKLKFLALHDALTGVYNRNWFYIHIRSDSKVFLTMADVNKLKTINDTLGHLKGDKFITECSKILSEFGDVIRFGGDEFIVISKTEEQFNALKNFKTNKFSHGGVKPDEYSNISEALNIADKRLYADKIKFEEDMTR